MVAPLQDAAASAVPLLPTSPSQDTHSSCALCGQTAKRHIIDTINEQPYTFCCYGCRYIYDIVWPDLAQGMDVRQAIGRAGLDLESPCCRGIIHGDPAAEATTILARLMLNAFLAMMVMVLSLALYSDFFFYHWGDIGQGTRSMLQAIMMLFATPAVLLLALPILEDAVFTWQIYRRLATSALIAIGSLTAYGLSVYATFTGNGHTYFETAIMTLLLVTLGRWLDAKTKAESNKALDTLLASTPDEARVIQSDGQERCVPIQHLNSGDRLRVRPGDNFAVDGRVVSGEGSVDEANITGESTPAYKGPGDTVYAGTVNLDGHFIVEAVQVGEGRVVGKLVRLLEEARLQRAPVERLGDCVAAYFVPTVFLLSVCTFVFWTWHAGFARGLHTGLAVLLLACPCALGVATPLTLWTALARAAQKGILIRASLSLEKLSRVRHLFLDKTGTLTTAQPTVEEIICDDQTSPSVEQLLQVAAALEEGSEHPLATAVQAAAQTQRLAALSVASFRALPGLGVTGIVDGRDVAVGSKRLVAQLGLTLSDWLRGECQRLEQTGLTVIYVAWDSQVQGLLGCSEVIRPTAQSMLDDIQRQRLRVEVLTGDSTAAGAALSRRLGVAVQSALLPPDKVHRIEQAETEGPVAMLGDGLNDAPAMARASVGIALGCGTDVTREAADISLLGDDLTQVSWTIALARRAYRTIGWNLIWSFAYNVIGIGVAMAGLLHPVLAAAAMVLSSAMVVGNALRIRTF